MEAAIRFAAKRCHNIHQQDENVPGATHAGWRPRNYDDKRAKQPIVAENPRLTRATGPDHNGLQYLRSGQHIGKVCIEF